MARRLTAHAVSSLRGLGERRGGEPDGAGAGGAGGGRGWWGGGGGVSAAGGCAGRGGGVFGARDALSPEPQHGRARRFVALAARLSASRRAGAHRASVTAGGGSVAYLHAVRCLVANPEAMSLALAAMGSEVSAQVGRALMRRLEA